MDQSQRDWVLWDGSCGFCSSSAQVVRKRDKDRRFIICQIQSCPRPPMTDALMERGKSEMMVITAQGEVMGGARGVLYIAEKTGAKLLATILGSPLLFWAVDLGYKLVARHRTLVSRVFFKSSTACGMENRFPEVD